MSIQYKTLSQIAITSTDLARWAQSRETSEIVALAIHAISDRNRTAEAIWGDPTPAEWDHVLMATENYIENGVYDPEELYCWGEESFSLEKNND